jgi:hypothetical protein
MTDHPNKEEILQTLHGMISERLFGGGRWDASPAECVIYREKLTQLGLQEPVPDKPADELDDPQPDWQPTALGCEIKIELMTAFLGFIGDPSEIPYILHENGLISTEEMRLIDELNNMLDGYFLSLGVGCRRATEAHRSGLCIPLVGADGAPGFRDSKFDGVVRVTDLPAVGHNIDAPARAAQRRGHNIVPSMHGEIWKAARALGEINDAGQTRTLQQEPNPGRDRQSRSQRAARENRPVAWRQAGLCRARTSARQKRDHPPRRRD